MAHQALRKTVGSISPQAGLNPCVIQQWQNDLTGCIMCPCLAICRHYNTFLYLIPLYVHLCTAVACPYNMHPTCTHERACLVPGVCQPSPKPKESLEPITKNTYNTMHQTKLKVIITLSFVIITWSRYEAQENRCKWVTIGSGFTSDCSRKRHECFFSHPCSVVMQSQFLFNIQIKTL